MRPATTRRLQLFLQGVLIEMLIAAPAPPDRAPTATTLACRSKPRRLVLQRVLNGRRVACEPFREPDRRGYRFRATGSYAGMLFTDMCGPNGTRYLLYSGISRGYTGRLAQLGLGRT